MRTPTLDLFIALVLAGSVSAAQAPATPAPAGPRAAAAEETTLTGCLAQGSGPNVFVLQTAKSTAAAAQDPIQAGKAPTGTPKDLMVSYVLAAAAGSAALDFRSHVNQQVRIIGTADETASAVADGAQIAPDLVKTPETREAGLPKITVKSIARAGGACTAAP